MNAPFVHLRVKSSFVPLVASLTLLLASGSVDLSVSALAAADATAAADVRANPFAAHNAYPWRFYGNQRLPRALEAGLKHIEIDITYDPQRQVAVVTHDSEPRGGEPTLIEVLEPVWQQWREAPGDGYTLILDFKTASRELAQGVQEAIAPHAELLSRMKKPDGEFQPGKVTVCLTGSTAGHDRYAELIPQNGEYLAFGDFGASRWQEDVSAYVPDEPAGFVRFVTYEKRIFMNSPEATASEDVSLERLREVVRLADERGYRMRVYTINPSRRGGTLDDLYWRRCVEANVHMIATDAYEIARDWWNEYVASEAQEN